MLGLRGLDGDRVADTRNHGSPGQAVCCQPIVHYAAWNEEYHLPPDKALGPGSVGENWTLEGATEQDVCIGDVYTVGSAQVQVSGGRYPCIKQERKLQLRSFHRRVMATMRTGFYLRVLAPGMVQVGDTLDLVQRPQPTLSIHRLNVCEFQTFDPDFARQMLEVPELADGWKRIFAMHLEARDTAK